MYKQRVKRFPRLPRDRQDLVLANEFTRTKSGKAFLLTQSASKYILIFSTAGSIKLLAAMKTWGMDGTFKVVPYWYEQLFTIHAFAAGKLVPAVCCLCTDKDIGTYGFKSQALISRAAALEVDLNPDTIICDFETALIPAIQGYFPNAQVQGCYFHFCQAVHRKVGELGLKTQYRQHEETRRKIRMLLATAFLPVPHVNTGVSLLEAGTTGTLAALFQYFWQEWMTDERLPLWNVYNVNIRTNNHLEGWHNRLNRKAGKSHNGLYELLQLLIAEQGVMDTLIQQVLSGNVTVGDLRRVNRVYAQKQRRVAQYTGEYTNGRRLLLLFLPGGTYLEGWHNRLNKKAGGNKLRLYKLLYLLKEEQGLLTRNPAAGSIRQISSRYAERQQRVMINTRECTSSRRTLERFLKALMCLTLKPI
ncbi:hypothetical protein T05_16373 [Trichinella murrelli]|uniref:MULE transposase domain-containing protein n=1 Tax=Trichinella murrelli TaxID=144512 RepID=A0A0V0UHZ7_9BILA|nr:hypothetical protein T05_16373 [Trichinella murrelli]